LAIVNELFAWLGRLEALSGADRPMFGERMQRLFAPTELNFDGTILRVVDAKQQVMPFGRLPGRLAVLCWPDTEPNATLGDQAIAAQLGAVFTLATNRRVEVAASDVTLTPEGTEQRIFLPTQLVADRALAGPLDTNAPEQIDSALKSLYGLPAADREAIGAAVELHYNAALLYDLDINAAYALAVAGIERLSQAYGSKCVKWSDWEHAARLDKLFEDTAVTDEQASQIREALLVDRHLRLRQTFASYAAEALPDSFWDQALEVFVPGLTIPTGGVAEFTQWVPQDPEPVATFVPSDRLLLRRRLLRSYDARSTYVHAGGRRAVVPATIVQTISKDELPAEPVEFVGIRAILRKLIFTELRSRSSPAALPAVVMRTPDRQDALG
jgi:hypothetical protein